MGANMQRQAVPLIRAEAPYIGTGVEARAARDGADLILAKDDGVVELITGATIVVKYENLPKREHEHKSLASTKLFALVKDKKSRRATCSPTVQAPTKANSHSAKTYSWL
ncbi:MAG: DNA-directed polymerase beta subunit [Actinomycetota bacterium]